jgi:hypothetical protein
MNGPFSAGASPSAGGRIRRVGGSRRRIAPVVAFLLFLATLIPLASASFGGDAATETHSFERRAVAERTSRSRFRRLEVASLVLIIVCGGAVTLWAIRRK